MQKKAKMLLKKSQLPKVHIYIFLVRSSLEYSEISVLLLIYIYMYIYMEKIPLHFIKTDSMTITLNVDLEIGTKDI